MNRLTTYISKGSLLLRGMVSLLLICFVLFKPIHSFASAFSDDQTEYNCQDSDEKESNENETDEKESFDVDDEEDNFSIFPWKEFWDYSGCQFINLEDHCSSDFNIGVISPPPEIA